MKIDDEDVIAAQLGMYAYDPYTPQPELYTLILDALPRYNGSFIVQDSMHRFHRAEYRFDVRDERV